MNERILKTGKKDHRADYTYLKVQSKVNLTQYVLFKSKWTHCYIKEMVTQLISTPTDHFI